MHRLPLLIALLTFVGCAPKTTVPASVVDIKAAPKARPVEAPAEASRAANAEIGRSAVAIGTQAYGLLTKNKKLQLDLTKAVADGDRLRKTEQLQIGEIEQLWKNLTVIRSEHEGVVRESEVMQFEIQRLQGLQRASEVVHAELVNVAKDAQAEAAENARLLGLSKDQTGLVEDKAKDFERKWIDEKTRADKMAGRLKIYDTIAIGIGVLTAGYLIVRFILPLIFPGFGAARRAAKFVE